MLEHSGLSHRKSFVAVNAFMLGRYCERTNWSYGGKGGLKSWSCILQAKCKDCNEKLSVRF